LLGAVYTVDRFVRTPEEVLDARFQDTPVDEPPPSRPRPCGKYVRAALPRDDMDSTEPPVQAIFGWMAAQVAQRNPDEIKPVVLLMDGQDSLWRAGWTYLPEQLAEVTEILDRLHALGYLGRKSRTCSTPQAATPPATSSKCRCDACSTARSAP